ncbi:hypothetical protein CEUSTIGMA_g1737.t1 [Chlamydomonas eustigma]|uniref:peptidylprolyl isomerase n=1 Tax=Chlamydomonas eustigma TaxID=1157962 RepID=A0A250WTY0_9CHLO|nr:hypothetical protein CEUSTIGMA_g1737.t1 [Chlamydomonas eustigma]|eukprot:GAX74288.1 hypothetical protein CEUSTIGMA_g1737.t1 [Chlamydomonas eustigma]
MSTSLVDYLTELRSLAPEKALEPELKQNRQEQNIKIKEDQDLRAGAVLSAIIEEGEGEDCPQLGDLVYVHVTVRTEEDDVLYSTRSQEGGNGQALAFLIEAGKRAPRAWEIALKTMHLRQISALKVKPSYGFQHPDCQMKPPNGVPVDEILCFEIQLVRWYPAAQVKALPLSNGTYRRSLKEGTTWENPRPPFEVTFSCSICCPSYDGLQMSGFRYFETEAEVPLTAQMGSGQLPPGLEAALTSMTLNERCVFVVEASQMGGPGSPATTSGQDEKDVCSILPSPPNAAAQVEVEVELLNLVQVRDMIGDGSIIKRRLILGSGEFPIDCPVEDTTVRVHYRVRPMRLLEGQTILAAISKRSTATVSSSTSSSSDWVYDSRHPVSNSNEGLQECSPLEFDTGCGEMPNGLEQAVKLMVPGEVSSVACLPEQAYLGRDDVPQGMVADDVAEFEVELVSFDRDGHWQTLSMEERFILAEKLKAKGNDLFRAKKYGYARARYERLQRMLDSTRDYTSQSEVERMDAFKLAVLSNLALCCFHQSEYTVSIMYTTKALEHDPSSIKLLLRRARAKSMNGDHALAEEDLAASKEMGPDESLSQEIEAELTANKRRAKAAEIKQRDTFKSFFNR